MVFPVCVDTPDHPNHYLMSTVSIGKPVQTEPKIKSHMRLISLAMFLEKIKFCSRLVYTSSTS